MIATLAFLVLAGAQAAPQADLEARLVDRGASLEFAQAVAQLASAARAEDLPVEPLADKAFEGLAKGYPPERVLPVVRALADRLRMAKAVVVGAGQPRPPGRLVAAAAEALGRGLARADVVEIVQAAPQADEAAVGLTVAASLVAQGLETRAAAGAVANAFRAGHHAQELLELPSITANWLAEGVRLPDILRRIRDGRLPFLMPGGAVGRPPGVAPGKGPPHTPPGRKPGRP